MNDLQWDDVKEEFLKLSEKMKQEAYIFLLSLKEKDDNAEKN